MRWIVLLINANLCCGIIIHINPIKIIAYRKNFTGGDHPRDGNYTGDEETLKKLEVEPLIPGTSTKSYAGFLTVNEKYDSNLFFWFFESENNPKKDRLVVWLQGQPNASSLYGLFDENGPYKIDRINQSITPRFNSWTKKFNVLYLDHCTSCGYSYTKHPRGNSLDLGNVGKNIIKALQQFFALYPNLEKTGFYLAGESMIGKYLFVIAHAIKRSESLYKMRGRLEGIMIGNGFMDALQVADHNEYLFQMGLLDVKQYDEITCKREYLHALIRSKQYQKAIDEWYQIYYSEILKSGYRSMYDVRNTDAFWDSHVPAIVTSPFIREKLKVDQKPFNVPTNHTYYVKEVMRPITPIIGEVLQTVKVLFYSGQFDMMVPYIHTALFLDNLEWKGIKLYHTAPYEPWRMNKNLHNEIEELENNRINSTSQDNALVGYVKGFGNLCHVVILNSGHNIGSTQPQVLFEMVEKFVNGRLFSQRNYLRNAVEDEVIIPLK